MIPFRKATSERRVRLRVSALEPLFPDRTRLEVQLLGAAKHFGHTHRLAGQLMCNLVRIDGNLVKPQQQCQAVTPCISLPAIDRHYFKSYLYQADGKHSDKSRPPSF
ncbi:hypothetical protein [Bradyrhizobium sp. HKCCYLR20261]|uniref:hypothetical protein n=1 Tax=unclassified Bradyrhizobium TaxID=2631580 RepID=UPI003EB89BA6